MGDVRTKLELQDNFSAKMWEIVASMNAAVEMAENFRKSTGTDINDQGLKNYQNELDKTNRVIRQTEQAAYGYAKAENEVSDKSDKAAQSVRKQADAYGDIEPAAKRASAGISGTADSLNNLFLAAGGYKVLQFVKSAFTDTAGAAIEFESAITGVYKTVDGTQEQLLGLSDAARNMALSIPSNVTEIAGVMESAGQLGIATDSIESFTETMIALGESTNLSADEAASSLAKFANVTGMSADNYSNLGSVIVDLGNNFATTEADIVNMSSYLASAASLAGLAETDILALATAMTSVGINAEAGGSSMSRLITAMQTAVETGSANLEQFASVADMTAQEFSAAFGENAIGAIEAFIAGLNDVERNGASASVILQQMDLDDIRLANTIKALASSSGVLSSAVTTANTAWTENTALTTEAEKRYKTLESKLQLTKNAANELEIAVGGALSPTIGGLADMTTEALKGLAGLADSCPVLTTGIMGTVGAVGTVTGAFSTLAPSITAVSSAMQAMNKTLSLGRIGLVVGSIALLGGVIGAIAGAANNAKDEVEDYNGTLAQCSEEISTLEGQYKAVVDAYGANSEAAKSLESQLEKLNAQYEKGGGAAADYAQRVTTISESIREGIDEYNKQTTSIAEMGNAGYIAAAQLKYLSEKGAKTNSDLDLMKEYADYLNDTFNCNIVVNYDTGDITGFDPYNMSAVDEVVEKNKKENAADFIGDPVKRSEYEEQLKQQQETLRLMQMYEDQIKKMSSDPSYVSAKGNTTYTGVAVPENYNPGDYSTDVESLYQGVLTYDELSSKYEESKKAYDEASASVSEYESKFREAGTVLGYTTDAIDENLETAKNQTLELGASSEETAEKISSAEGVVSNVWNNYSGEITKFAEEYQKAFGEIRSSLDGMFDLFEDPGLVNGFMNLQDTFSMDTATSNIQDQIDYFSQYNDAVKQLSGLKMDNDVISQLDPEQAVAFAQELGNMNTTDAEKKVKELNDALKELSGIKDNTSQSLLEVNKVMQEEFNKIKQNVDDNMEGVISQMGLSADAANSAKVMMDGYIAQLKASGYNAVEEAMSIALRISKALSAANAVNVSYPAPKGTTVNGPGDLIGGYATGTLSAAPGLALVGENGPELVNFGGGEVVYTAQETQRILSQQQKATEVYIPENLKQAIEYGERFQNDNISMPHEAAASGATRRVVVEIAGNGSIEVTGGANKEELLGLLMESVEPAIMDILLTEIYEEGDDSYEY